MGSIAQDKQGDIAAGFSASGPNDYPSVRYTGRAAGDPLGQMTQAEQVAYTGTGPQTEAEGRWGDYSDLTVDPSDDCTFWYTQEYLGQDTVVIGNLAGADARRLVQVPGLQEVANDQPPPRASTPGARRRIRPSGPVWNREPSTPSAPPWKRPQVPPESCPAPTQ